MKRLSVPLLISFILLFLFLLLPTAPLRAQQGGWTLVDSAYNILYYDIACADSLNCMAVGTFGGGETVIRRSTDAGITWRVVYDDTILWSPVRLPLRLRCLAYPTPDLCIATGDSGLVVRTTDGGKNWSRTRLDSLTIDNLKMFDARNGVMKSFTYWLLRTTDGGASWNPAHRPDSLHAITWLDMTSTGTIEALTGAGNTSNFTELIATSDDLGNTWRTSPIPHRLFAFDFIDADRGWAVGADTVDTNGTQADIVYRTTDGGRSWQLQLDSLLGVGYGLDHVSFLDQNNGLASGQWPKIIRTTDGGLTWKREKLHIPDRAPISIKSLCYASSAYALAGTTQGEIIRWAEIPASVPGPSASTSSSLYPNPARPGEKLFVLSPQHGRSCIISLNDMLGRTTLSQSITGADAASSPQIELRLDDDLPTGVYFVRVVVDGEPVKTMPLLVR